MIHIYEVRESLQNWGEYDREKKIKEPHKNK